MTDSNQIVRDPPHATPWGQGLWPYLLVGLAQGLGLWGLSEEPAWIPGPWLNALVGLLLAGSIAWFLGDSTPVAWRKRLWVALGIGLLVGLLGSFQDGGGIGAPGGWNPARVLPTVVLGFVLVTLSAGFAGGRRRLSYTRLFDQAWRNALALPLTGLLDGVWSMLIWAGAWLMNSIGLTGMETLLLQPWFHFTVGGTITGLSMGAVLRRSEALATLRRFWLGMNSSFLPLSLAFASVWLAALLFTGVQPLFATRKAAFFLLWFCTLAVVFANAAYQDGHDAPSLPAPLSRLAPYCVLAWPVVPVLALLGDWALWQRVQQHGWTVDRIWAAVVGVMVTLYGAGYALSSWRRRRWMWTLPATNIGVSLVMAVVLLALLSPVADIHRIAVDSQVARLLGGQQSASEFDWAYLRQQGAKGQQALQKLAALPATEARLATIAQRAGQELQAAAALAASPDEKLAAKLEMLRKIEVLPADEHADPALLQQLANAEKGFTEQTCLSAGQACLIGLVDLDGNGVNEALLLAEGQKHAHGVLYALGPDGWKRQGDVMGGDAIGMAAWKAALQGGGIETAPPAWPDLLIAGERRQVRR